MALLAENISRLVENEASSTKNESTVYYIMLLAE